MKNEISFKVYGEYALFTDPVTRAGGEKYTYHLPTYQALKGIVESIYWKPTLVWFIDRIRVMNAIKTETKGIRPIKYKDGKSDLSYYTYLRNVEYQVQAHFEWNYLREDLEKDRNENKHYFIAKRMLERGGRRDIFLGTRECQGYVEPINFGEDSSFYDGYGEIAYDRMFHGFDYPSETGDNDLVARFWDPNMVDGIIEFVKPEKCNMKRILREMDQTVVLTSGFNEEGLLEGFDEEVIKDELDSKTS